MGNWKKKILVSLVLVVSLGAGGMVMRQVFQKQTEQKNKQSIEKRSVTVEVGDVTRTLTLSGKVRPLSSVDVMSPVSGQIREILVKEGERVSAGQVLFSVMQDTSGQKELEGVQSDLERARLEYQSAQDALDRRHPVKDLFAEAENAKLENDLQKKKIELQAAENRLNLLKSQLGLENKNAGKNTGSLVFGKAPREGYVTFINKSAGDNIIGGNNSSAVNNSVLTLSDTGKTIVRSRVLEADLSKISNDMPAEIRLDAFRDLAYSGKVSRISQQGQEDEAGGYTFFVTDITFDKVDGNVRSQMNATVTITVESKKAVLRLPASAVATLNGNSVIEVMPVDVKKWDGKPHYRKVKTGVVSETWVEILQGMTAGEKSLEIDFAQLDTKALSKGELGDGEEKSAQADSSKTGG